MTPHCPRGTVRAAAPYRLLAAALLVLAGCGRDVAGPVPVATLSLEPDSVQMQVGDSLQLKATARGARGDVLTGREITWSSSDTAVAEVTGAGLVRVRREGAATITASAEGQTGTVKVAVAFPGWALVTPGEGHSCALSRSGRAYCWGRNHAGQLGTGSTDSSSVPVPVKTGLAFSDLSARGAGTCGVSTAGDAFCWGHGSLGSYGTETVTTPRAVAVGRKLRSIDARGGGNLACGLLQGSPDMQCWSFWRRPNQETDTGEFLRSGPFRAVTGTFPCHVAGDGQTAACSTSSGTTPATLGGAGTLAGISAGTDLVCAWSQDGRTFCTTSRTITHGIFVSVSGFREVSGGHRFTQASAGWSKGCGVTEGGRAYCWPLVWHWGTGGTASGGLGSPTPEGGNLTFAQISTGGRHVCGLTREREVHCWGNNQYGQLGGGTPGGASAEPVKVREP